MKNKKLGNKKPAFHKNMESMTLRRIESMRKMDSYDRFRLLQDHTTGFYVVFNNFTLSSHYSWRFNDANSFFDQCIEKLD